MLVNEHELVREAMSRDVVVVGPTHSLRQTAALMTRRNVGAAVVEDLESSGVGIITERDYEELRKQIGLAHFEGRGWRGFHHHATLCIAAYGFLIRERAEIPPCGAARRQRPDISDRPRPRGAADPARTSRRQLDSNHATQADRRARRDATTMSLLSGANAKTELSSTKMTQ